MGDTLERRDTLEQGDDVSDGEEWCDEEGEYVDACETLPLPVALVLRETLKEKLSEGVKLVNGVSELEAEGERDCSIVGVAEREDVSAVEMEGVGTLENDTVPWADSETVKIGVLLFEDNPVAEPWGALGETSELCEGVGKRLALGVGESRPLGVVAAVAEEKGVALAEGEAAVEVLAAAERDLLAETQPESDAAKENMALRVPLTETLSLTVRLIEPVTLAETEKEVEEVEEACGLPLDAPLPVGANADPVSLVVLLLLNVAHEDAEAWFEVEALLQPLTEELPLIERVTAPVAHIEGEKEFVGVAVVCRLPLDEPLSVVHVDPVTLAVLLLLEDAHEDADAPLVVDALLQLLTEELPLTERVNVLVTLTEGETEFVGVVVTCELPLGVPLPVGGNTDPVTLAVLLLLGVTLDDVENAPL